MSSLGKSAEAWIRRLRPYLKPAYRKAHRQMMARGLGQRHGNEPLVVCDFTNPAIDAVGGRYYFSLVLDLIDAGYFPVFTDHRATVSTFGTSRIKSLLLDRRLGTVASLEEIGEPFLLITDSGATSPQAVRTVRVDYEARIPARPGELAFPVFVHPQIAVKDQLPLAYDPTGERPARIFFGGNTSEGKYDKNVIGKVYGMLTRREMLENVRGEVGESAVFRPHHASDYLEGEDARAFVLCETQVCRIPPERWLEALSKGDFFLACPGVGMPLCHNLVEAMAAGAVPILQYSRYLSPALEDGVNCLTFHDAVSLREVTSRVLAMSRDEVLELRRGTNAYYEENLAPGRFAKRLLVDSPEDPTLLINAYRVPR